MTLDDALRLVEQSRPFGNVTERCIALHDFVRDEIGFGFTFDFHRYNQALNWREELLWKP